MGNTQTTYNSFIRVTGFIFLLFLMAFVKSSYAGESGFPDPSVSGSALLSTGTVNFKPITFKVDKVDKVKSIVWTNKPDAIHELYYSFKTKDGIIYTLEGYPAYKGIFDASLSSVNVLITGTNGSSVNLSIPVAAAADVAPTVSVTSAGPLTFNKGHHSQVDMLINDPGRNVLSLRAVLYSPGDDQNVLAVVGERNWGKYLGWIEYGDPDTWDIYDHSVYETQAVTNTDVINYRLPIFVNKNIATGGYDLRIEAKDSKGNISLSDPVILNVLAPVTAPRLILTAPDYRIPSGESYVLKFTAEHLDSIDRIEFTQSGPVGVNVTKVVTFENNDTTQDGNVLLTLPESASADQIFTISATIYDVSGSASTVITQIDVGLWGERTVEVTSSYQQSDESMLFANVNIVSGGQLIHQDSNVKFNNLTISENARMKFSSADLVVKENLLVNGILYADLFNTYNSYRNEYTIRGGQHGGDVNQGTWVFNNGIGYGDFRNPSYPGSNILTNEYSCPYYCGYYNVWTSYTGGYINISANSIILNTSGSINANGGSQNSGGGVINIASPNLLIEGNIKADGTRRGAGGSINIKTSALSGSLGYVSASGGASGAGGGRIAIYYDTYEGIADSPWGKLQTYTHSGKPNTNMGAGTVFLKRTNQEYGDLHIDNNGATYTSYTSLFTLGKHALTDVVSVANTTDQYRVTVEGKPWQLKNKYGWDTGVIGKYISLNAADKSAPVFKVIDEIVATDGIDINHSDTLAAAGNPHSVKLYPLNLTQDEDLYFNLDDQAFIGKVFVFSDADNDGIVTTSDLVTDAEFDAPSQEFNPFKKLSLTSGNYIVAVSRRFVSAGEAVLGQSNSSQTCNDCTFSLSIKSVNTNSFIIQSATPPIFTPGNEMIGVVRLNHLEVSPGSVLRGAARIHSDTFDIAEEKAIDNIPELVSSTSNNLGDVVLTANQSPFYVGNIAANSLSLTDGAKLTVYGDLDVTNNVTISNASGQGSLLSAQNISVAGILELDSSILNIKSSGTISAGNLSLLNSSKLTVPFASIQKKELYTLNIDVLGKVDIDTTSSIDLTGKGYPAKTGLDFIYKSDTLYVGHGGEPHFYPQKNRLYGPYGNYEDVTFPGVGGYANNGGGFLRLKANELLLNGYISVDGQNYSSTGGGINITTNIFNGSGRMSAVGGRTKNSYPASGGRISIIAGIDNFTNTSNIDNAISSQYENSSGPVYNNRDLAGAGTTYITNGFNLPGHLIVDNTFSGLDQATTKTTSLRMVGRQKIIDIQVLVNNQYRIMVAGSPWRERVTNPDGLGLKGLKIDLIAADESGELYEIIDSTENTILITSPSDITAAINQELIGVITLDKITVLGGAILEITDRLVLNSPTQSIVDSNSKLITAQISESTLLGLISQSTMGQLEFTDKISTTNLNITSGYLNFSGGLEVTTLEMAGGRLRVNSLDITDGLINNAIIEAVNINVTNNLDLISGAKITAIPQSSDNSDWVDNVHHSLNINVSGILNIDIESSIDVSNGGYKYAGTERIGEYSVSNGDTYRWWREYSYGCHGGTSVYSHNYFLNWSPDEKYQTCEYGSYRQAQYAGLPGSNTYYRDDIGFGGGFVQINAGTLNQNGKILANGTIDITSDYSSSSAGGGINIKTNYFSGSGFIEARGSNDNIDFAYGYRSSGPGGRISVDTTLSNLFDGLFDAGPGLHEDTGYEYIAGSAGTVYLKNPGEAYGNLTIDNFTRQSVTANGYVDFPKTNIPSVGKHTIKNVVNLGNNKWRLDTDTGTLFESYNDSVTATGQGSLKIYNISLTESKNIQVQMENPTSNFLVYLLQDRGDHYYDYYSDVWFESDIGSKTLEINLPPGDYFFVVGGSGDANENNSYGENEIIAVENTPENIHAGSYDLAISSTNDTWYNKKEKRLQGNFIAIEDNPTTSNEYEIYYNSESSLFVESNDDLSSAIGKNLIGIHNFQTLKVKGNSHVSFGGDKVNVLDMSQSEFSSNAKIEVGSIDQSSIDYISSLATTNLTITDDVELDHLTLNSGNITFNGLITASNNVEINNAVDAIIKGISANNITIKNSTLKTDFLHSNQNITISNDSVLSTIDKSIWYESEHTIDIISNGTFTLDVSSTINLQGKGYNNKYLPEESYYIGNYGRGCHGGRRFNDVSSRCVYGKYLDVKLPGSKGNYSAGGGYINIKANEVVFSGKINANALPTTNVSNTAGGAGGGVSIDTLSMSAGASSSISASGVISGGGGRISIKSPNNYIFDGTLEAKGGTINATDHSGAGTIFIQSPQYPNGYLLVDNNLNTSQLSSTPLSAVGKHTISQATRISTTEIQVHVGIDKSINVEETKYLASSGTNAINRYHFTLDTDRVVRWKIHSDDFYPTYWLYKIENGIYSGWYLDGGYDNVINDYGDSLPAGDYMIAVGSTNYIDHDQGADEINGTSTGIPGNYSIEINTISGSTWLVDKEKYGWGLAGYSVDLDANDGLDKAYTIITNSEESLVIQDSILSDIEINALTGNELVGLHVFDRLSVKNGAAVTFGDDRVIINSAQTGDFEGLVKLSLGGINESGMSALINEIGSTPLEINSDVSFANANLVASNIMIKGNVNVASNLTLSQASIFNVTGQLNVVGDLSAASNSIITSPNIHTANLFLDGATVKTSILNIDTDLTLIKTISNLDETLLTALDATVNPNKVYPLDITVGNEVVIDPDSAIDVTGKGYPARIDMNGRSYLNAAGPDFNFSQITGCNAGKSVNSDQCITYGRLENARFAGSADGTNGGGTISINANIINNLGNIKANGVAGNITGAGGSINLTANSLTGAGSLSANGGSSLTNSGTRSGGGGRISINLPDSLANDIDIRAQLHAIGGQATLAQRAGAGTIYIKYANEEHGHLIVDNEATSGTLVSTPIRQVGRKTFTDMIIGVSPTGDARYELSLGTNNSVHQQVSGTVTATGVDSIQKYPFTLNADKSVNIEIVEGLHNYQLYLLRDNNNGTFTLVTPYTYTSNNTSALPKFTTANLPLGDYIVAVSGEGSSATLAELESGEKTSVNSKFGDYVLKIDTVGDTWATSIGNYGWGLDGLRLTLTPDFTPATWEETYTIISNTEESLTIDSPIIQPQVNTDMTGVHVFETMNVRGYSQVDFGQDIYFIKDQANTTIEAGSLVNSNPYLEGPD